VITSAAISRPALRHVGWRQGPAGAARAGVALAVLEERVKDISCVINLAAYCIDRFQDTRATRRICDKTSRPLPPPEKIRADTADDSPAVKITCHFLAELKNACAAKQARLLAAYVPGQAELAEDDVTSTSDLSEPEERACRQAFDGLTHGLGIDVVDLMSPMVAAKQSGRFPRMTFAHDFHWNSAGHTVAAEALAAEIARREEAATASASATTRK